MAVPDNALGAYLKDRRAKLDPAAFGFTLARRRTPGLRREEVAQRAHVSATWYTWLEQGRGGAPSADVLDRIARAMMLTDIEREHIFLLGLGRPPEVKYRAPEGITPRLQRILDALEIHPAFIKTPTWDVVAWNKAAASVLTDYSQWPQDQRNIMRMMFHPSQPHKGKPGWVKMARFVVAAFRMDAARAGATQEVRSLVEDLCRQSAEFAEIWNNNEVRDSGDGGKVLHNPIVGEIALEFSSFAVDGRPDLGLCVYTPMTDADAAKIKSLLNPAKPKTEPARRKTH
jgi:transcriptional regulator with XRE-family HTH domain